MTRRSHIHVARRPGARRTAGLAPVLAFAALAAVPCGLGGVAAAATAGAPTEKGGAEKGGTEQGAAEQGLLCRDAVRRAEAGSGLPAHLLAGIARVESGRRDPVSGHVHPWPWTVNLLGEDHVFATKAEAVAFVRHAQARGLASLDVGCLQINLMYHPDAFQTLEEAFDPLANARYAVKFLGELHARTGSWESAASWYHSANPAEGGPYQAKVVTAMAEEAAAPEYGQTPPAPAPAARPPGLGFWGAGLQTGAGMPGLGVGARFRPAVPGGMTPGGMALVGRGLDAYRARPVTIVGAHLLAAR